MNRNAKAIWMKGIKDGSGTLTTDSGVLSQTPYSFKTRFEEVKGTNPEELIAAAHAGCFSMALSAELEKMGLKPENIETIATVNLEKNATGYSIPMIHLQVKANISNGNQKDFDEAAKTAKENCPISKLMNAKITMSATLQK